MEKVKITAQQAKAFELAIEEYGNDRVMNGVTGVWNGEFEPLNDIRPSELARAIYDVGYEVEPEFKVGDWVVKRNGEKFYITHSGEGFPTAVKITKITTSLGVNVLQFCGGSIIPVTEARHATPQEIATEKTRRWWAKHDRDVWELREFDELRDMRDDYRFTVSEKIDTDDVGLLDSYIEYNFYRWDEIKEHFAVVCFAEDRKDK